MKYFLIGLPGVGKSYWGKVLSHQFDLPFLDLDELIEKTYNKSISDIFKSEGEETFRRLESETLKKNISNHQNFILACGGGTPCFNENLPLLKKSGVVIYLKANSEYIYKNLQSKSAEIANRPLLNNSKEHPKLQIDGLLELRNKFYKKADHIINVDRPNNLVKEELILCFKM